MPILSCADSNEDLIASYGIDDAINRRYPELLHSFHAALAVAGAMSLARRQRPLTLILKGGSGTGKSRVIQSFFPLPDSKSDLRDYVYRSDIWTSKSFVSHASTSKKSQLRETDLLPRLKDKILLTKELATLFRGHENDLMNTFKTLIAVLDGEGLTSDSGTHGQRGYEDRIVFNWLGGTTPLPDSTYRLMSQLGNRLLFWEVPSVRPGKSKLLAYLNRNRAQVDEDEVRDKINLFLSLFFQAYPVGSFDPDQITWPDQLRQELTDWAELLVEGRAEVRCERIGTNWTPVAAVPPEGIYRPADYLEELAMGHCLIHGRTRITQADLSIVGHTALSSIPGHLSPLVRQLGRNGKVDTADAIRLCGVSHPTARHYLTEIALLGLGDFKKGDSARNQPNSVRLAKRYSWLPRTLKSRNPSSG